MRTTSPRIMPFYAEDLEQFPAGSERAGLLVVKTHIPSASLLFLTKFARGTVFLTVREPRDSVASLMQRFGHPFAPCVQEVAAGAARMVELARVARPLILRYEERFFERSRTIERMATRLGFAVQKSTAEHIFRALSAEKVHHKINTLAARGVFGVQPDPDRFDPRTHWHPGHVGDGKTGKYAEVLTSKMQRMVLDAMQEYCVAFGYDTAPSTPPRRRMTKKKPRRGSRGSGIQKSVALD